MTYYQKWLFRQVSKLPKMRSFSYKSMHHFEITTVESIFTFLWNFQISWMKLTHIFTFLCENVKKGSRFHFFLHAFSRLCVKVWKQVQTKNYLESNQNPMNTRFYSLFYVIYEVSAVNLTYLIFYCGRVSREKCWKLEIFPALLPQKMKLADGFMGENWHKIVRGVPSVTFFFPTNSGRFHNFSQFSPMKPQPVSFWA